MTANYGTYAAQNGADNSRTGSTKKKETDKTSAEKNSNGKSKADYASNLAKLVPSVEFKVGNGYSSAKTGKTLTVNPKLLEEMQNNPEKEKEIKELMKGVESMTKLMDGIHKASGWKTVFRHSYIDENGQYRHFALIRNEHGYKMSDKLREERRKKVMKTQMKTRPNSFLKRKLKIQRMA